MYVTVVCSLQNCLTAAELLLGEFSSEFLVITTGKRQEERDMREKVAVKTIC
jgi:hypothetical protein